MKPLNYKEVKQFRNKFVLIFSITLLVVFSSLYFTFMTAQKGVEVLEKKHQNFNNLFEKQTVISLELDDIIKLLYKLKNKNRTLNEHIQFQKLISASIEKIEMKIRSESDSEFNYSIYTELLTQVKAVQATIDEYKVEEEEYIYNKELLERCRKKYQEIAF